TEQVQASVYYLGSSAQLEADRDNLRAALAWYAEEGDAESGLRLAHGLATLWVIFGRPGEGRSWIERLLSLPDGGRVTGPVRARALSTLGAISHIQSDYARAMPLLAEALELFREAGENRQVVDTLLT